jgi:hypothetical protein
MREMLYVPLYSTFYSFKEDGMIACLAECFRNLCVSTFLIWKKKNH